MYILGNISYFETGKTDDSVAHWTETIRKLRQPTEPDTNPSTVTEDIEELNYYGPRLGDELPTVAQSTESVSDLLKMLLNSNSDSAMFNALSN